MSAHKAKDKDLRDMPLVSIIIPTYNSERTIGKCLESIKRQTYKNIEVIIVDKGSDDKTIEIATKYGARIIIENLERSAARNRGIKDAKGEYLFFLDSDMELTPTVVEECVKMLQGDEESAGVIIPERSVGRSFWVKVRDFERSFYKGTIIESPRFFRRDVVMKAGGYDENTIFFEESTIVQKIERLGYNVRARIGSPILHHEDDFSLLRWLKKKYYYGKTLSTYARKYGYASKQISPMYRLRIFLIDKRFWQRPLLAIGVLFLKLLEYTSIRFGDLLGKKRKVFRALGGHKMTKVKVSVIVPSYNNAEILNMPLGSFVKSTYRPLEVIIVDAGMDETPKIVEEYKKHFKEEGIELKYYKIKDRGVSYSRNFGACKSSGDLLFFLDSDGIVEPETIEKAVNFYYNLIKNGVKIGAIQCILCNIHSGKCNYGSRSSKMGYGYWNPSEPKAIEYPINFIEGSEILISKRVFEELGGFDDHYIYYFEVSDFSMRLLIRGYEIWANKEIRVWEIKGGTRRKFNLDVRMCRFIRYHLSFIFTYCPLRYLIMVFPLIVAIDCIIGLWVVLTKKGSFKVFKSFCLFVKDLPDILNKRKNIFKNFGVNINKIWKSLDTITRGLKELYSCFISTKSEVTKHAPKY